MLQSEILQLVDGWQQSEGCIDWSGPVDAKGYGRVALGGNRVYVHRFVFSRVVMDVLDHPDVAVMHLCDNPKCINPAHLVAGSTNANMFDMKRKARSAHGSNHPASMLTAT